MAQEVYLSNNLYTMSKRADKIYQSITGFANYSEMNGIEKDWIIRCIENGIKEALSKVNECELDVNCFEDDKYIYLSIESNKEQSIGWETLQNIKDKSYPDLNFIEVYPSNAKIVNKANVRHLIHIKGFDVPMLSDLENAMDHIFNYKSIEI